jgi:hypothetical protein
VNQATLRDFATRVNSGQPGEDVQLRYRVAGGMPAQRLECEVLIDAMHGATVSRFDARVSDATTRAQIPAEDLDVLELLRDVSRGLHTLVPANRRVVRLPDSLVGRLTVVVDGAEETFSFVPERALRRQEGGVSPSMDRALERLWELSVQGVDGERADSSA